MKYDELIAAQSAGKRRKPQGTEEHNLQVACVKWFRLQYPRALIFAVPNGGARNAVVARHMKEEGQLPGVSDLIVMYERRILFVEMKTQKGRQSPYQELFEKAVERFGFRYEVCRSFDDFRNLINQFMV